MNSPFSPACSQCAEAQFAQELQDFVGKCQVLAGSLVFNDRREAARILAESLSAMPHPRSPAHAIMLRGLLAQFAARHRSLRLATRRLPSVEACDDRGELKEWLRAALSEYCEPEVRSDAPPPSTSASLATRAADVIGRRYSEPTFGLRTVARLFHVSVPYLRRIVRAEFGVSFRALLRRHRIEIARGMLRESARSVKEIAAAVGYSSNSQFVKHFKQECGVTPTQFRANGRAPRAASAAFHFTHQ